MNFNLFYTWKRKLCYGKIVLFCRSASSVARCESRRRSLEINPLYCLLEVVARAHKVAEVLVCDFSFDLVLACLLLLLLELLDIALQTDADVICGALERTTDL